MTPEATTNLIKTLSQIAIATERIANALEAMPQTAPDIRKDLSEYPGFDWASIGATVIDRDHHGAKLVSHNGKIYKRRNPLNKYGIAIWYSRATGKEGEDTNYERLISFTEIDMEVDPLNEKTVAKLRSYRATTSSP